MPGEGEPARGSHGRRMPRGEPRRDHKGSEGSARLGDRQGELDRKGSARGGEPQGEAILRHACRVGARYRACQVGRERRNARGGREHKGMASLAARGCVQGRQEEV